MRKLIAMLCAVLMTALLVSTVWAEPELNFNYSGPLDNFTGVPEGNETAQVGGDRIRISTGVCYDRNVRAFAHTSGSGDVISNVASGTITTDTVTLNIPDGMTCILYRDGEAVQDEALPEVKKPGSYVLMQGMNSENDVEIMRFTIVKPVTGKLETFQVPTGFTITSATFNGGVLAHSAYSVSLAEEGEYQINYRCPAAETSYSFNVTTDHTAPTLLLAEVQEDGRAKGPVSIADLEPGATVGIWLNGKQMPYAETLTGSGAYRIVVADEAGNMNTYQFVIQVYFNVSSIIFFFIFLALAAGVGIYVLYTRRHLRVR